MWGCKEFDILNVQVGCANSCKKSYEGIKAGYCRKEANLMVKPWFISKLVAVMNRNTQLL